MEINNSNDLRTALNGSMAQFDPTDYPIVTCDKCGGNMFVPAVVFREVPGIYVGDATHEKLQLPVHKVYRCAKCGEMFISDREMLKTIEENKQKTDDLSVHKTTESGLII